MSILGVIVRTRPDATAALRERLAALPGVDVALDPGDGRLILVIEDAPGSSAAARLTEIGSWPSVVNTSLVYEHIGVEPHGDAPAIAAISDFSAWRHHPHSTAPTETA
jgi:periplasmic nitrate reductase NapD